MEKHEKWSAAGILEVSGYYWKSAALHAAVVLDVFSILGTGQMTAREVSENCRADSDGMERLLDALAAMGLVSKSGNTYENTDSAARWLDSSSEDYLGHIISHHHHLVSAWASLDRAVVTGKKVRTRGPHEDENQRESFLMGMHNLARLTAPQAAKAVDLSGCSTLLDLGGGPGTFAIYFCLQYPGLRATVADLPATRPFAERNIASHGLSDRISFAELDHTANEIQGPYDAAWLSHVLHGEGPQHCSRLLEKAVSALVQGGKIIIHDFILDNNRDSPLFPALFSLNMLVNTDSGRAYSEKEITGMLEAAGAGRARRIDFQGPNDSAIIEATAGN
ncbi:MAG: methyltransferase [Desulfobacterales bacterium]